MIVWGGGYWNQSTLVVTNAGSLYDAFTDTFLCVRGTAKPWHKATQDYAERALERFRQEWARFWRGELPVRDDADVSNEDNK